MKIGISCPPRLNLVWRANPADGHPRLKASHLNPIGLVGRSLPENPSLFLKESLSDFFQRTQDPVGDGIFYPPIVMGLRNLDGIHPNRFFRSKTEYRILKSYAFLRLYSQNFRCREKDCRMGFSMGKTFRRNQSFRKTRTPSRSKAASMMSDIEGYAMAIRQPAVRRTSRARIAPGFGFPEARNAPAARFMGRNRIESGSIDAARK